MAQLAVNSACADENPERPPKYGHQQTLQTANDFLRPRFLEWGSRQVMAQVIQLAPSTPVPTARVLALESARDAAVRTDAIYVLFTSIDETIAAAKVARDLAATM